MYKITTKMDELYLKDQKSTELAIGESIKRGIMWNIWKVRDQKEIYRMEKLPKEYKTKFHRERGSNEREKTREEVISEFHLDTPPQ
ncbi:uncharacterized protein OCT59_012935 [Rhizophagus irregularis]|uniref:uncharacterized protein n=1 Tax=Rhizophagus irregularis TaxID=588596 RepID=UPI003321B1CB|nr:hypothetical protein OCT59_012935 [Rhizophagus irregularis]